MKSRSIGQGCAPIGIIYAATFFAAVVIPCQAQDIVAVSSGNWFGDSATVWDLEEDGIPDGIEPVDGQRIHIGEDLFQGVTVTLDADLFGSFDIRVREKSKLVIPSGVTLDSDDTLRSDDFGSVIEQTGGTVFLTGGADIRIDDDGAAYILSGGAISAVDQIRVDEGTFVVDSTGPEPITEVFAYEYRTNRGNGDTTTKFIAGPEGVTPIDAGDVQIDSPDGQTLVVDISAYDTSNGDLVLFRYGSMIGEFETVTIIGGTADVDYEGAGGQIVLTNFGPDPSGPPTMTAQSPSAEGTMIGKVTHVDVAFDEAVTGVSAEDLTVNGSPATSVIDLSRFKDGTGPWLFWGFEPVTEPGVVEVILSAGDIHDLAGNPFAGDEWSFTLDPTPALLMYEGFDYTNGSDLTAQDPWRLAGGNPLAGTLDILNNDNAGDNGTSSLEYPGLPSSTGGRTQIDLFGAGSAQAVHDFPRPLVGEDESIYVSFLYKPTGDGPMTYWQLFQAEPIDLDNHQRGRVDGHSYIEPNSGHLFQARFRNSGTGQDEEGDGHPLGTTLFLVGKLSIVPGDFDNDTWEIWINPDPVSTEPTPDLVATGMPGEDINPAGGIFGYELRLRPTSNSHSGQFQFDELRIGTTWEAVVLGATALRNWEVY